MNAAQAKRIPLEEVLGCLGHEAVRQDGKETWFNSPVRKETVPSFCISRRGNVWYDHGVGRGGNIIDLMAYLYGITDVSDALQEIKKITNGHGIKPSSQNSPKTTPLDAIDDLTITKICPLRHYNLKTYVQQRGIPISIAAQHVKEMHYERSGKPYYTLAFENRSGGYEIRNVLFQGAISPKDITIIEGQDKTTCAIFEGFFDFLSALTYSRLEFNQSAIVLNSVALKEQAAEFIKAPSAHFQTVHLYLDRDANGQQTARYFEECLPHLKIMNRSDLYAGYKDFNQFLIDGQSPPTFSF